MEPYEREHLEELAHSVVKSGRRRMLVLGLILVFAFSIYQTALIIIIGQVANQSVRELADRVDRNAAFSACVLAIDPDRRTPEDIGNCLKRANLHLKGSDL